MGIGSFVKSVGSAVVSPVTAVVDGATDAVGDIADVAADLAGAAVETTLGATDFFIDGVTHVVTPISAAVWESTVQTFDMTVDTAKYIGTRGVEMVGEGAALVGPAIELTTDLANAATLGLSDDLLDAVDDHVLDTIDEATGGLIDIDYDDGGLSVNVGIDDVVSIGLSIGEDGLSADSDTVLGGLEMGVGDGGVLLEAEAGIDVFPLPYAKTHLEVDADGNIDVNGVVQGPYPYPVGDGILAGRVGGGFQRTEEGWMVDGEAKAVWIGVDGTQISGEVGVMYGENDSGTVFSANASGEISGEWGTAGAGVGYSRIDQDGVVIEQFDAEAHATGFGMEAEAGAQYVGIETPEGSASAWETDFDVSGVNPENVAALGADLLGIDLPEDLVPASGATATGPDQAATIAEPNFADPVHEELGFDEPSVGDEFAAAPLVAEDIPALVEEPTVFTESIDAADTLEDSMDDLFEGLD